MNSNPNGTGTNRDVQLEQELNGLRQQYEQLRDTKVRTEQDITNQLSRLETLKAQALSEYGTDDLEALQALLNEKRLENEKLVSEYREHIQKIQADLSAVENEVEGAR